MPSQASISPRVGRSDVLRADAKCLSVRVFRSHTVTVGITYARTLKSRKLRHANRSLYFGLRPRAPWLRNASASRHSLLMSDARASTLKSRQLLLKPQKNTAVTIGGIFLVEVTGLEPTTSWSLRRRWLCSTRRALCFRRILAAAPPLPEKMLRLFSGSPSFRVSALVLRPRGGSCPALSQKDRRATCSAAFLVEVTGLAPLAARPGAQPTGLVQFAFPLSALKLRHANRSLYFGLRPRAPWLRNASVSRHSLLMSDARASTLKSRQLLLKPQKNTAVTIGGIFL